MSFRYQQLGKYLVCLDQPIYAAVTGLLLRNADKEMESIGIDQLVRKRISRLILKGKLGLTDPDRRVTLPVFGHVAKNVQGGIKVFDLGRKEVSKVFAEDISPREARKEIEASKLSSSIAAAPRYLGADPEQRWYREEYIQGEHATTADSDNPDRIAKFYTDAEKCLIELVGMSEPDNIDIRSHIDCMINVSFQARWRESGLNPSVIDGITEYLGQLERWLKNRVGQDQLPLVLTHRDFSLVNAIWTDGGLRFIDWEGISPGALYSDILNFLYVEYYYGRAPADFRNCVSTFTQRYRNAIVARFPELRQAADMDPTIARRIYYLERMNWLLRRSATNNLSAVVEKSIQMFNEVDREFGDTLE